MSLSYVESLSYFVHVYTCICTVHVQCTLKTSFKAASGNKVELTLSLIDRDINQSRKHNNVDIIT